MPNRILIFLVSAFLLLSAASVFAQSVNAQVTGSVAYRERMALPADAVIGVQLIDASVADIAAQTVAEVLINAEGRQAPVPFTLDYDPAQIVPGHRYSIRASIRSADSMLMFSTTQAYPVLTHGAPSKVNLILHTVGHGAKPGTPAKKAGVPTEAGQVSQTAAAATESKPQVSEAVPQAAASRGQDEATNPQETPSHPATQDEVPTTPVVVERAPEPEKPASTEGPPSQGTEQTSSASMSSAEQLPPTPEATTNSAAASAAEAASAQSSMASVPTAAAAPAAEAAPSNSAPAQPEAPVPTTASAETKPSEAENSLPEAPSASKRAELSMPASETPDTATEPEGESTSRPERPLPNKALTPLADTQWRLIQLGGQEVVITAPQKPVTLAFSPEGGRIAGSAGCNSYLGTFHDDHGHLELHPGSMTLMACADPAGSREKKFVAMLRSADGYKINGDFLVLVHEGKIVAKFKNNPPL